MPDSLEVSPVDSEEDCVYDSEDGLEPREGKEDKEEEDDFENQWSSDKGDARQGEQEDESESEDEVDLS